MRTTKFAIMAQVLLTACGREGINTHANDPTTNAVISDLMPVRTSHRPERRPRPAVTYSAYEPSSRVVVSKPVSKRAANAAKRKAKKTSQKRNRK